MSNNSPEQNRLEAEIAAVQDEINRRHARIDNGVDIASNQEKIDILRDRRAELKKQLANLG